VITLLVRVLSAGHRRHVAVLLAVTVAIVLVGGELFALSQKLPFTTGLYWAITTATTVGYGDVTPHNAVGRVLASVVMLTTIPLLAAVFALVTGATAVAGIRRILTMQSAFPEGRYRLVVGMNPVVPAILEELSAVGIPVVLAADVDPETVHGDAHLVRGDPTDEATIRSARPQGAEQALITGASDGAVLVSAVLLRKQAPDLTITALTDSPSVREALIDLGVQQAVSGQQLVARALASSLETPHAGEMLGQLVGPGRHVLAEVGADGDTIGRPLSAVRSERAGLVLGLVHDDQFSLGIGDDPTVREGDRLLVAEPEHRS
jgi:voltage-gated potassium channel